MGQNVLHNVYEMQKKEKYIDINLKTYNIFALKSQRAKYKTEKLLVYRFLFPLSKILILNGEKRFAKK